MQNDARIQSEGSLTYSPKHEIQMPPRRQHFRLLFSLPENKKVANCMRVQFAKTYIATANAVEPDGTIRKAAADIFIPRKTSF